MAALMTMPPMGPAEPALWMTITDVFHIKGRGTVVTGELEGNRQLNVGDSLLCDGQGWQVIGIEQFRAAQEMALPGSTIGILLKSAPAAGALRGRTVQFEPGTGLAAVVRKRPWRH